MGRFKKRIFITSGFIIFLFLLFLSGPLVNKDFIINSVNLPFDLDTYLHKSEKIYEDITPGTEKKIIWAEGKRVKTKYSIIYLHGFSATRKETFPLSDRIAKILSANLFYTRFTGHGRNGKAMLEGSVNKWINDGYEALKIGERIGEKVIIIGVSTGGTIATILSSLEDNRKISAVILISPNYSPRNKMTKLMLLPWGNKIAELVIGKERSWEPDNEMQQKYWTHKYPTSVLLPMMGLVSLAESLDFSKITTPYLFIYSPNDQIVDTSLIEKKYLLLGSAKKKLIPFTEAEDTSQHVLAGDILSKNATAKVEKMIVDFLKEIEE